MPDRSSVRRRIRAFASIGVFVLVGACAGDDAGPTNPAAAGGSSAVVTATQPAITAPASTAPAGEPAPTAVGTAPPETASPAGVQPAGFTTATVRVTAADGEVCEVCMWLADDGDERGRGLMGVTDLGGPVGMAFVFPQPIDGAFFMFGTPTPLSIAWFAADGAFVSATDMEPCTSAESGECERFRAEGTYRLAIEVFQGGLDELGIGPGSTAEVLAGTESATCALATDG